jgi:ribosome-associated protein
MNAKEFSSEVCKVLSKHKGEDVVRIDLTGKSGICDYFVIASGRSQTHTRTLIEKVDEEMEKLGVSPIRADGVKDGRWGVLDYGDVIVHVFNDQTRLFYHLEKLWGDEKNIERFDD